MSRGMVEIYDLPMKLNKTKSQVRELSPEKTEAILEGAMQEFLEQGYSGTTMDKIAAAAGVSKATVYSHFQDKEALFKALIEKMAQEKCSAINNPEIAQGLQGKPEEVLRFFANNMLDSTIDNQEFLGFMRVVIAESGRFPELARTFISSFDKYGSEVLREYLNCCKDLKLSDPDAISYLFIGSLVHFLIHQEIMHGKDVMAMDRDRLVNSLINLVTNG